MMFLIGHLLLLFRKALKQPFPNLLTGRYNVLRLFDFIFSLSGLIEKTTDNPNGDIEIRFTGLRPGEKLYEELLIGDNVEGTDHPRIMTANETFLSWPETHNLLNRLDKACHDFKVEEVINLLLEAPAAFNKQGNCPDWVLNASHNISTKR
jgi:FlaA1/EpsC-like NDP-sugar epimerase